MSQLQIMGFPDIRCKKALLATGNSDPEAAMEWLFAHMDDAGELESLPLFLNFLNERIDEHNLLFQTSMTQSSPLRLLEAVDLNRARIR